MTNAYFKKENDIILNGTLWKEVEDKFMLVHHLQITKNTPPPPGGPPPASHGCGSQRIIYCRKCIHLLYKEK